MSSAQKRAVKRHPLVLVQGGHGEPPDTEADWDEFCQQIGWQQATPEQDATLDNLEERLAERLFAKLGTGGSQVEGEIPLSLRRSGHVFDHGVERVDGDAARYECAVAEYEEPGGFGETSGVYRLRASEVLNTPVLSRSVEPTSVPSVAVVARQAIGLRWGRAPVAAVAVLAVAAALVLLVRELSTLNPNGAGVVASAETARPVALTANPTEKFAPINSVERPVDPPRRADPNASKANPKPKAAPVTTAEPPGTMVARASFDPLGRDDSADGSFEGATAATKSTKVERSTSDVGGAGVASYDGFVSWGGVGGYGSGLPDGFGVASASLRRRPGDWTDTPQVMSAPDISGARDVGVSHPSGISSAAASVWSDGKDSAFGSDVGGGRGASAAVWSERPALGNVPEVAGGRWSFAPTSNRWIGASVTPDAPAASVGAMVHLNLGTAFRDL